MKNILITISLVFIAVSSFAGEPYSLKTIQKILEQRIISTLIDPISYKFYSLSFEGTLTKQDILIKKSEAELRYLEELLEAYKIIQQGHLNNSIYIEKRIVNRKKRLCREEKVKIDSLRLVSKLSPVISYVYKYRFKSNTQFGLVKLSTYIVTFDLTNTIISIHEI